MEPSTSRLTPDAVAEHAAFLRTLARRLVDDEHTVEDLVQEAQMAALVRPPSSTSYLRQWFVRVLRNLSVSSSRADARRALHERAAGGGAPVLAPGEVGQRLETQRLLGEAVESLAEPYRTAVYLRYFEDLPPREIAARLGVPSNTVKTRLQRALDMLRQRLDAEHGGKRKLWCSALAPLIATPAAARVTSAGGLGATLIGVVVVKFTLAVCFTALAVFVCWVCIRGEGPALPGTAGAQPGPTPRMTAAARQPSVSAEGSTAPRVAVEDTTPDAQPRPPARGWTIEGRVVDRAGVPLRGARIELGFATQRSTRWGVFSVRDPIVERTDADGRYAADLVLGTELSSQTATLVYVTASARGHDDPGYEEARLDPRETPHGSRVTVDFTLEPAAIVRGTVLRADGSAADGVRVVARLDDGSNGRAVTDAAGRFVAALDRAGEVWIGAGDPLRGLAKAGPFGVAVGRETDVGPLTLPGTAALRGRVRLADGTPFADERFSLRLEALDEPGQTSYGLGETDLPEQLRFASLRKFMSRQTRTDQSGEFVVTGLARGAYRLDFVDCNLRARHGPFRTGELADITMDASGLRVRVVDQQGLTIDRASVAVEQSAGGDPTARSTVWVQETAQRDGTYHFLVRRGSWSVVASAPGAAPAMAEVDAGVGGRIDVELTLDFQPATGSLQLSVSDDAGEPVESEVRVALSYPDFRHAVFAFTTRGEETLSEIPVGRYRASFAAVALSRPRHYFPIEREILVEEDRATDLRVEVPRGGWLLLDLRGGRESGEPGKSAGASATGSTGPRVAMTLVDPSGGNIRHDYLYSAAPAHPSRSEFAPATIGLRGRTSLLRPGRYVLRLSAAGHRSVERRVEVRPLEDTEVAVRFEPK